MFCIYCGKEIKDGETCSCRSRNDNVNMPSAVSNEQAAAYAGNNFGQPGPVYSPYNQFNQYGTPAPDPIIEKKFNALREALRSPILIILAILYSAAVIISDINLFSILTVLALWLIFATSRRKDGTMKVGGFKILSGINIAKIVLISILYALCMILLIVMIFNMNAINDIIYKVDESLRSNINMHNFNVQRFTVMSIIIACIVMTVVFVLSIIYYSGLKNSFISMKFIAKKVPTYKKISGFSALFLILGGVFNIVSTFGKAALNQIGTEAAMEIMKALSIQIPQTGIWGIPRNISVYFGSVAGICAILGGVYLFIIRKRIGDAYKE